MLEAFMPGRILSDEERVRRVGLCLGCKHIRQMRSDRGAEFYLCSLAYKDPAFPKYPRLPMAQCPGYHGLASREGPDSLSV